MTVISAVITRYCTIHVSDSLITRRADDGTMVPVDPDPRTWHETKIVRVPEFRGAMTYWGLSYPNHLHPEAGSTIEFMKRMARDAHKYASAESFANGLRDTLNQELAAMQFERPADKGVGLHFTAYERVDGYWIPELFQINNYTDTSYQTLSPDGVHVTRETFHGVVQTETTPEHGLPQYRLQVHRHLQDGEILTFNQGDPRLFNPAANAVFEMIRTLYATKRLEDLDDAHRMCMLARTPVEQVSSIQRALCKTGSITVGGKTHDLAVTSGGVYYSTSGD